MLTKNLLCYRLHKGCIYPEFVAPDNAALLAIAEQLISVFEAASGASRNTVLESSQHVLDSTPGQMIVKRGLEKLLLDRTEFDTAPNEELITFRQELFARASQILTNESFPHVADYQKRVASAVEIEVLNPENGNGISEEMNGPARLQNKDVVSHHQKRLYADLPGCHPVLSFKTLSAERMLHRYNCAQVQGLLLHCNTVTLILGDAMTAELRQLFKYLRFNQLLSTVQKAPAEKEPPVKTGSTESVDNNLYRITIDGPLNLFYKTKRYGMNLANFFVAVLHQPHWKLRADVRFRNQSSYRLYLDESCGIKPISQQFLAYIPEDILLFQEMLHHKTDEWQISPGSHFLPLAGDFYCFPDYELVHNSGVKTAIELFHPWHQGHLIARLHTLAAHSSTSTAPLILGVSNDLMKKNAIANAVASSAYFSQFGFTFRTVPTMGALLPVLNSLVNR